MYEPAPVVSIIGLVILVLGILVMGLTLFRAGAAFLQQHPAG